MNHRLVSLAVFIVSTLCVLSGPSHAAHVRKARLIVSFLENSSKAERENAAKDMGLKLVEDLDSIQVSLLEASGDVRIADAETARRHPSVVTVEEDVYRRWLYKAHETLLPAQPGIESAFSWLSAQKTMPGLLAEVPWGVERVDAPAAWPHARGAGAKVAVIDTGIDCPHQDLRCDFGRGANFVDPGFEAMDDNEHGTHVAGTIGAHGGAKGVVGVAPEATLIPVKVLNAEGAGHLSDIIQGIEWATKANVDVINMSLGGDVKSAAMERAINNALAKGIVLVAAAGNEGPGADTVGFPAGYPGVIAVAASDKKDRVAPFSSRGDAVAFIAPGVNILSTVPGGHAELSGTSMASPHVAGLAALAISRGVRGQAAIRRVLDHAAVKLRGADVAQQGHGLIDAGLFR